jgi:hypothetical protein
MRRLVDLSQKSEIGFVDWEFLHDMQMVVPELITPEIIQLSSQFISKIPVKWQKIKQELIKHSKPNTVTYVAISDVENLGNEFKVTGKFKDAQGNPLAYHKIVIFDEDRFQDDYIGSVISDDQGYFSLLFGKKTFSDFGIENEPDIYFKIYRWEGALFKEIKKVMPKVTEKVETGDKKIIYNFGVMPIDVE